MQAVRVLSQNLMEVSLRSERKEKFPGGVSQGGWVAGLESFCGTAVCAPEVVLQPPAGGCSCGKGRMFIQRASLFHCVLVAEMEARGTWKVRSREEGDGATRHGIPPCWERWGMGMGASMAL